MLGQSKEIPPVVANRVRNGRRALRDWLSRTAWVGTVTVTVTATAVGCRGPLGLSAPTLATAPTDATPWAGSPPAQPPLAGAAAAVSADPLARVSGASRSAPAAGEAHYGPAGGVALAGTVDFGRGGVGCGPVAVGEYASSGCPSCGPAGGGGWGSLPASIDCSCGEPGGRGVFFDPREYICDGGDVPPFVRDLTDIRAVGLQPEDTVIQYRTEDGQQYVQESNRVCVYAPRFAAVRSATGALSSQRALEAVAAAGPQPIGSMQDTLPFTAVRLPLAPQGQLARLPIESLGQRQVGELVAKSVPPLGAALTAAPDDSLGVVMQDELSEKTGFDIERLRLLPHSWVHVDQLSIIIDGREVAIARRHDGPEEVLVYEIDGKPRLQLIKRVSQAMADSGDELTFSLHFENVGEQPAAGLIITDSLSPRLSYVEGSQQSSRAARFATSPNEVGSSVVRWEILDPLKPGEGGSVSFRCRVR
jgi:uncharacterized repeat protein (TIGR01451 family)